jgi:signal transduction histidine kinase
MSGPREPAPPAAEPPREGSAPAGHDEQPLLAGDVLRDEQLLLAGDVLRDEQLLLAGDVLRDEQLLLAAAVQRLHETSGCELAAAWARSPGGEPYVAAAVFEGTPPPAPDEESLAAALALPRALTLDEAPAALRLRLRPLAEAALVAVATSDGTGLAALLVASRERGVVRPRTLARLAAAAQRLAGPLAGARAARRLLALEAEVRRLDRLAALGLVAAEIAHEVRNPLVSVKTFLQLLPERRDDPEFTTGFLGVASEELQRVERLLDAVVAHPRELAGAERAAVDRALDGVGELLRHFAHARGVRIERRAAPDLPEVAAGADALRQLLLNLALNAVSVTAAGGSVELAARAAEGGVLLEVLDQGPGVPASEHQRIFEPFHSTRPGHHAGLGLSVCRRIAEEAGGRIEVESAVGGGARFRVWLPAAGSP